MFAAVKPDTYVITISDDSQNYVPKTGETNVASTGGLKFFAAGTTFDGTAGEYTGSSTLDVTVTLGEVSSFSSGSATVALTNNTFLVGAKGVDSVTQYATDVYVIKALAPQS